MSKDTNLVVVNAGVVAHGTDGDELLEAVDVTASHLLPSQVPGHMEEHMVHCGIHEHRNIHITKPHPKANKRKRKYVTGNYL